MCLWADFLAWGSITHEGGAMLDSSSDSFRGGVPSRSMKAAGCSPARLSSCASALGLSVLSDPSDGEETSDLVRERLLLHWVNSLPITKCLLVEELRDLRFGDVLLEIVELLQHDSVAGQSSVRDAARDDGAFDSNAIEGRLRRVIQFVARECRSQDGRAMYIVNDQKCQSRVMAGESDVICAVLTVLRRLSVDRAHEHKNDKAGLHRRREQERLIKLELSLHQASPTKILPKEDRKPKQRDNHVHQTSLYTRQNWRLSAAKLSKGARTASIKKTKEKRQTKISTMEAKTKISISKSSVLVEMKESSQQPSIFHDNNGLRVFGMLDPTVKYQSQSENSTDNDCSEDEKAKRFCSWTERVLNVDMPLSQVFVKREGEWKLNSPRKIQKVFASGILLCRIAAAIVQRYGDLLNQSFPGAKKLNIKTLAAVANPRTPAEMQNRLSLAVTVFKVCGLSPEAGEALQHPGKPCTPKSLWTALIELTRRVKQIVLVSVASKTQEPNELNAESLANAAGTKENVSSQIGNDKVNAKPTQTISAPGSKRREKPVVDNITVGCAPLKRSLPYITSEQMHVVNEWLVRVGFDPKKVRPTKILNSGCSVNPSTLFCSTTNPTTDCHNNAGVDIIHKGSTSTHPAPLLLDIPAVDLTRLRDFDKIDQEPPVQIKLHATFARRLAWNEDSPGDDDDDDLFPVPKVPFSSPVYTDFDPVVPEASSSIVVNHDADILPVPPDRSDDSVPQIDCAASSIRPPSIAIAELSG
ncbi:unnamed protein product [Phytophthora lilii]|uniref:Unnamed protein product n=1 Tax=Phytophthora lilii TaxID=2077276 RepID=A0A9W6WSY5_9STRA|nr:unnamed protein product [Phytophthora lilii]